jgi:hypothetical protein
MAHGLCLFLLRDGEDNGTDEWAWERDTFPPIAKARWMGHPVILFGEWTDTADPFGMTNKRTNNCKCNTAAVVMAT